EDDLKKFLSKFKPASLKKGEYFIREGQISRKIGFIVSGSMLCSYNKDGEEIIDEFSLDKEFITDYFSFLTNSPAEKDVKCLENTELIVISYEDMQQLYAQNPMFEKVGRLMAEALFMNWQQKAKSLMLDDAKARYLKLITRRPDLPQRVPQYLIASYLNVKPETLSRIRKKMASK
ncbi:MAG: Crp/Fnr family transcriptional regulator, partial [Flavobacteriales bacterium]|nr:Crp/Fnr family transcriptional regulator [Flavobacteriales bacterium]